MENTAKAVKAIQNLRFCSQHITKNHRLFPAFCVDNKHMKIHGGEGGGGRESNSFTLLAFPQSRFMFSHFSPPRQNLTSLKREG